MRRTAVLRCSAGHALTAQGEGIAEGLVLYA